MLIENIDGPHAAVQIAMRILGELRVPFRVAGHEMYATGSIGIALSSTWYRTAEEIVRDADTAMYRAKARGGNRCEIFDAKMHGQAVQRMQTEMDLRRAVERDEFRVAYHPIVSLRSGELHGFEALLRWEHPTRGTVMPAELIAIAEETRLIIPIGSSVLAQVCRHCEKWSDRFAQPMVVSVNLSLRQLEDPDLVARLEALERDDDRWRLRFEITESAVMEDAEAAIATFTRIRSLGFELSIDDSGTGYSSLSHLINMPIRALKIDRSFIARLERGHDSEERVRTIIHLAHDLRLETIAEGVETAGQVRYLIALGCDYAPGFFFGMPMFHESAYSLPKDLSWISAHSSPASS